MKLLLLASTLIYFEPSTTLSINELTIPDYKYANYTKYFVQLIKIYSSYHKVYHLGTKSKDVYDETISSVRKTKTRTTFSVFNYDEMKIKVFKRPNASNLLHVVYTTNPKHWEIFTQPYAVSYRDVVIFISITNETEKYRNAEAIKLSGKVLIIQINNSSTNGIFLSQVCYYCGNISRIIRPIIGTPKNNTLLPYNYKDLNNHELNITFTPNYPFIYCDNYINVIFKNESVIFCPKLEGIESHMIKAMSKKMNFRFKAYSEDSSNSSFYNMLASITENKYDFAIGSISITLSRRKIIQFTIPFNVEKYMLLYKVSRSLQEILTQFFDPVSDTTLWIIFYVALVLLVVLLYLIERYEKANRKKRSLVECFWLLLQIQLEQSASPMSPPPNSINPPLRDPFPKNFMSLTKYSSYLLAIWCLSCFVLSSAFKGVTLSTLLRPPRNEPQGLLELLERGYIIAANTKSRDIVIELLYELPIAADVYFRPNNCDIFTAVQTSKMAMMNEWSALQYQLRKVCPTLDPQIDDQMRITRRDVRSAGHAWATQRGAPYRTALDYYLSLILSGGLNLKWTRDLTYAVSKDIRPFRLSRETHKNMQFRSLSMYTLSPLFAVYITGVSMSCITFILEIIFFYGYVKC